jgi:hypothetical protein
MAWWDTVAKIGGVVAAPFTGGLSLWPSLALAGGSAAAGYGLSKLGGGKKNDGENPEDSFTDLLNRSSQDLRGVGSDLRGQGNEAIGPILSYLKDIYGSNPSAAMDATRADRGRVIDQYDTARKAISQFGPRGGGTTSALAQSQISEGTDLNEILSGARNEARGMTAQLGTSLTGLGLSADQLASMDLNSIIGAILRREGFDVERRGQNMGAWAGIGEAVGTILASKYGGGKT